ncbi:rod shape-determining protein MreC [Lewinella sp. LCG006]|uniref:rod shape-determining protein MreC n=1 Tax=Lewinella sp. LCG006 TaxID=3231911 RepID=UPI0034616ECF
MSSLLQLFTRQGAFFLFATLEVVCLYLIITYNTPQQEVASSTWNMYSGVVMERASKAQNYLKLEQLNDQLREENAALLSRMPNAFYTEALNNDTIQNDSLRQRYNYIAGEIINKSPLSANITYVVNRGHIHGVEPHLGVINGKGVVGIVVQVAQRHCRVMSITHRSMRISAGLRNKNFFGSLRWNGGDTRIATLYAIPEYADVAIGDTVETTGYSNIFPTGVPIGSVSRKNVKEGDNTLELEVKLFNNLYEVKDAYIVRDLMKGDLDQLDNPE